MAPRRASQMRGAPGMTRTCDLQVRNLALYPTELRAREAGEASESPGASNLWRRGWDSNPRYRFRYTRSPGACLQPLGHLSARNAPLPGGSGLPMGSDATKGWRRGRDSNPRYGFPYAGLANLCLQPLGHLPGNRRARNIACEPRPRRGWGGSAGAAPGRGKGADLRASRRGPPPAPGRRGMAEREGFEPSRRLRAWRFSRPLPSTARPPLRLGNQEVSVVESGGCKLDASNWQWTRLGVLAEQDRHVRLAHTPEGDALDDVVQRVRICVEPLAAQAEEDERADRFRAPVATEEGMVPRAWEEMAGRRRHTLPCRCAPPWLDSGIATADASKGRSRRPAAPRLPDGRPGCRGNAYSLGSLLRIAASSLWTSAGESCGRSTRIVSLCSVAVSGNGGS